MDEEIERILAYSEIRSISDPLKKAVFIKMTHDFGYRRIAAYFKISRSALRRTVKAFQEGRILGCNGCPSIVQPEDETKLKEIVEKIEHGEDISHQELIEEVIYKKRLFY